VATFDMPKSKRSLKASKPRKEKHDFARTAFSVFQKATGIKGGRQAAQRSQSRSGRGK
jgi:hypothetical protein